MHLILKKEIKHTRLNPDVTAFILKQPTQIQKMMNKIRSVILHSSSNIHESIKYMIPFYSHKGLLCYLNPTNDKVIIGFSNGAEFANDDNFLVGEGKIIRHAIYRNHKEIKPPQLQHLIFEALIINEIHAAGSKKKIKSKHKYI